MKKKFKIENKEYEARTWQNGEVLQIAIFSGENRRYNLEVTLEMLQDMHSQMGTSIESLVDFVIGDFQRYVKQKLLKG